MATDLLTIQEVCDRFMVTRDTLRAWIREGRISCLRLGPRSLRVSSVEVDRFLSDEDNKYAISSRRDRVKRQERLMGGFRNAQSRNEETPAMQQHN